MPCGSGRIFITPPSIADSWISNFPAEAVEPPISRSGSVPVLISFIKPPATSEPFGVARDQGCSISIEPALNSWADAEPMARTNAAARKRDFIVLLRKWTCFARDVARPRAENPGAREEKGLEPIGNQTRGGPRGAWPLMVAICGGTQSLAGSSAAIDDGTATLTATPVGSAPAMPCPMAAHIAAQGGSRWAG